MFQRQTLLLLTLVVYASTIRVPIDNKEKVQETEIIAVETKPNKDNPIIYTASEENVDSYLIPPDPHTTNEYATSDGELGTPATYLLPPLPNAPVDYLEPQPPPIQTDWYPIVQAPPKFVTTNLKVKPKAIPFPKKISILLPNPDDSDVYIQDSNDKVKAPVSLNLPLPSTELQPPQTEPADFAFSSPAPDLELPVVDDKRDFVVEVPSTELELPVLDSKPNFSPQFLQELPINFQLNPVNPTLSLQLTPPRPPALYKYKNPTNLYPKKYVGGFKPVPIPLLAYDDERLRDILKLKPVKLYNTNTSPEDEFLSTSDEKKLYQFEKAEQQRKLQEEEDILKHQELLDSDVKQTHSADQETEPEASETGYRLPARNRYPGPPRPVPLRLAPRPNAVVEEPVEKAPIAPPAGDRTEFRMHGMNGPHSYQFGYDTGKGKNRQFRYEERDNDGRVRGHYGYVDKAGKLRVVKYDADPEHGFHSDAAPDPIEPQS